MGYYGSNNDYWDFLAHARKAQERPGHKYVARVEVGVKKGKTVYRYFYSQKEYDAYLKGDIKGTTTEMLPVSDDELRKRLKKAKIDMDSIDLDYAWKDDKGNLYIGYTKGGIYVNQMLKAPSKVEKMLDAAKEKVSSLRKKTSDFIKKALSKVVSKKTADSGKDFVDKVLDPENATKDYKVSEVGVRARSHTYVAKVELPNGKHRYFYSDDDYQRYLARQKYQEESPDFMKDVPRQDVVMTDETQADSMAEINEEYNRYDAQRSQNCMYCTTAYELRQRGYDVQAADRGTEDEYEGRISDMFKWYKDPHTLYLSQDGTIKDATYYYETNALTFKLDDELRPAYNEAHDEYNKAYDKASWFEKTFAPTAEMKTAKSKMDSALEEYNNLRTEVNNRLNSEKYIALGEDIRAAETTRITRYTGREVFDFVKSATEPNSRGNFTVSWYGGGGHSMIYETDSHGNVTIRDAQTNRVYQPRDLGNGNVISMQITRTDNLELKPGILKTVEAN